MESGVAREEDVEERNAIGFLKGQTAPKKEMGEKRGGIEISPFRRARWSESARIGGSRTLRRSESLTEMHPHPGVSLGRRDASGIA